MMRTLFTLLLLIPVFWMGAPLKASADVIHENPAVTSLPEDEAVIVATSWNGGRYGYYGRWDHRHGHHHHFDRYRHGYAPPRFYGHRYYPYYPPYRYYPFHGQGYYHRFDRGHFGFSACYFSGSVRICVNEAYPYR